MDNFEKIPRYSSDFETTTEAVSSNETWVWAWSSVNIYGEDDIHYGSNITSFIDYCKSLKNSVHYFHNLKFDGTFIIDYLFRELHMEYLKVGEKPRENTFQILMNKMGIMYAIDVWFYKDSRKSKSVKNRKKTWVKVKFIDSLKIIPLSVSGIAKAFNLPISKLEIDYDKYRSKNHILTPEEKDYITNDVKIVAEALRMTFDEGHRKMTSGSNSLNGFKETMGGENGFRHFYPIIKVEYDEDMRKAYRGGYVYVNKNYQDKVLGEGLVFDKNSMYPSHMHNRYMPYGMPHPFKGKYEGDSKFYIQHIIAEFKVKEGMVPTIMLKNNPSYKANKYIRESIEETELFLTNLDLELFLSHYDVSYIEYINGYWFFTNKGVFNEFIDMNYAIKQKEKGGKRQLAKLQLNSLYGKFITNTDVTGKYAEFKDDKVKYTISDDKQTRNPEYSPVGIATTMYARYDLITTIDKLGGESPNSRFVYCDTDSVHILGTENPKFIPQHPTKLDYWKCESKFNKAKFIRAKTYIEEIAVSDGVKLEKPILNVKCAGMPKDVQKEISFDNFKIGYKSGEKLVPKIVKGGMLLVKTTYELKE